MKDWLIIDGYNLLHQIWPVFQKSDIPRLRKDILLRIEPLVNAIARRVTVVFDGNQHGNDTSKADECEVIEVIYSPAGSSADSVIEKLVWKAGQPEDILVVTSDRLIRDAVSARGADTMASSLFVSALEEQTANLSEKIRKLNKHNTNITLSDFFPPLRND